MIITVSFLILGILLWQMPVYEPAIFWGLGIGVSLFLLMRAFNPMVAMGTCLTVITLSALYTFLASDVRAMLFLGAVGVIAALVHHNALIVLDVAERHTSLDLNHDGAIGVNANDPLDAALRYVFGFTNQAGDTFKRRIARENLTALGYMGQREWREWVRTLEWAGVIQCVNAQVTRPMVSTYAVARQLLDAAPDVVLAPHPEQPGRMVRQ